MAFGFAGSSNGGANAGPDLETIQTEALGFLSIAGDAKVRLTSAWSDLPAATSSLLSVASKKGLVAAAGPDHIIIGTTESIRKAFESPKDGDSDIRSYQPQLRIPMSMRVSQLAFTADENYLVLSAESGGGLAVYEVASLLQGSSNSAFELSTNGEALRALVPNPTSEKAELIAIVTNGGNLHMANLSERKISNALKNQVTCVSWSSKGKQLCAGLADGSIYQMTPEGEGKAEIPKPPSLGNCHVSSLMWLENHLFLSIHSTADSPPSSTYHVITRQPSASFNYQKLTDPDLLIVASTASTEVGLLSRSKSPLANDKPADSITGVFTTTELLDDTKRPTLPMTDSMDDSTPIGIVLDLSGKEKVYKPIPSDDELEESPGPLPGFWILTHEGILCSWWVVYTDSIKKGTTYPGLAVFQDSAAEPTPTPTTPAAPKSNPFSSSISGASPFAQSTPAAPAFGSSAQLGQKQSPWATAGATGSSSTTGGAAFGQSSFGASASGGATFGKTSFGQSSQLGSKASPWASAATPATPAFGQSGFASFANKSSQSPFGSTTPSQTPAAAPTSGGFATFASKGGFASLANNNSGSSIFGNGGKSAGNVFGSGSADTAFPPKPSSDSIFGTPQKPSGNIFGSPLDKSSGSAFGSTPFKLQSSFKPDPSAKEDNNKPSGTSGSSMFGSAFGSALGDAGAKSSLATPAKDQDMDTMESAEETPKPKSFFPSSMQTPESTTPTTTPAMSRFGGLTSPTPGPLFGQASKPAGPTTGLFGGGAKQEAPKSSAPTGLFGALRDPSKPSGEKPAVKFASPPSDLPSKPSFLREESSSSSAKSTPSSLFGSTTPASKPGTSLSGLDGVKKPESAPFPPDFMKANKPTETSSSSDFVKVAKPAETPKAAETAPLPLDPLKSASKATPVSKIPIKSDTPLPPDPTKTSIFSTVNPAASPSSFVLPKASSTRPSKTSAPPLDDGESDLDDDDDDDDDDDISEEEEEEEEEDEEEEEGDDISEGSGVDVAKDLSPTITGVTPTYTPQSSFGGLGGPPPTIGSSQQDRTRPLFGEVSRNAPVMVPRPSATTGSPESPSPMRGGVPNRVVRADTARSVSAPGMASQILGPPPKTQQLGTSVVSREKPTSAEDAFIAQQRKLKERQQAEEGQLLVDADDDQVQKVLASEIKPALDLDEFIAHSNVAPPARESVPAQVEAVYRDINSMIDTLGLNARAVKAFTQGHTDARREDGRTKEDLEDPDDWVLCELGELGEVIEADLPADLDYGRVQDLTDKLDACQDLVRDLQRLRAKQEDLKRVIMTRIDPTQADVSRTLPLSVEQATQQNELRREFAGFSKVLAEAEEALTLLKTRIASVSSSTGRGNSSVPTVEAVVRTITKMTSMVEKRSGDIDVLETQLRKMRIEPESREGSPLRTPQARRSILMSPEATPSRSRHSMSASIISFGGAPIKAATPRKKLSGFSSEEKGDLMDKRAKRQAVLAKLKESVEKKGVSVWTMEDIE
ncbi:Nuclear pore protein [Cladobotryum mycophilum]|uniref:Nuclear pore protein n=1 Tax=Cladobotryum mycophilum TaxID=491253 RepID=A0ABR0SEA2_9HYPO